MANESVRTEYTVGEILRRWGPQYSRTHPMPAQQRKVLETLARCRTAELGGHLERCEHCGRERPVYNSCGDRHCPTCQGKLARKWLQKHLGDLLPTAYFHTVFTVPDTFNVLVPRNERVFYNMLFKAASQSLRHLGRKHLKGDLAVIAVLHTWGQTLWLHPHIHCIVSGGALSLDRQRWRSTGTQFLFDVYELSADFRKRFCRLLRRAKLVLAGEASRFTERCAFTAFVDEQEAREWVVYCKKPFSGPEVVLEYISRYTHRVALSNRRIQDIAEDGTVSLSYKDYRRLDAEGRPREQTMELAGTEFVGHFLRHILPRGFRKVRRYGLLAGRTSGAKIAACRAILGEFLKPAEAVPPAVHEPDLTCPYCGKGTMQIIDTLLPKRGPPFVKPLTQGVCPFAA